MPLAHEDVDATQVRRVSGGFLYTLTPHSPLSTYLVTKPLQVCDASVWGHGVIKISMPPEDDSEYDTDRILAEEYSPFHERDFPGGYVARFDLYRAAWKKCLDRIEVRSTFRPLRARIETRVQHIVSSLHAPVVDEIVRCVHRAYDDLLPGLPRVELPVFVISGMSLSA